MTKKTIYQCRQCRKTIEQQAADKDLPECCEETMEKMEDPATCQMSSTAEHARPDDSMEPCDDGRSG